MFCSPSYCSLINSIQLCLSDMPLIAEQSVSTTLSILCDMIERIIIIKLSRYNVINGGSCIPTLIIMSIAICNTDKIHPYYLIPCIGFKYIIQSGQGIVCHLLHYISATF